jgi:hypothetical protein
LCPPNSWGCKYLKKKGICPAYKSCCSPISFKKK